MFSFFRKACERLLRLPPDPVPPGGDANARVFRAAPRFYQYKVVTWAIGTAFILFFLMFAEIAPIAAIYRESKGFSRGGVWPFLVTGFMAFIFLAVVLGRLFTLAVLRLDFEKRWYLVTDRSLRIREGVMAVREMTVTFANIQNVSVAQGPLQRLLGLSDVVVETAGGGAMQGQKGAGHNLHTAIFRGIDNAAEVQALIQQRLRHLKDTGLGDHDDAHPAVLPAPELLDALRAVHAEARALREAVGR